MQILASMRRKLKVLIFLLPFVLAIVFLGRKYVKSPLISTAVHECHFATRETLLLRTKGCWGKYLTQRWKRFYNDTTCKDNKYRAKLKKLLEFWIEFAEQYSIRYALMWGTLLGLERVNDILPWDHDMDIIIDYKDILKLERIADKRRRFQIHDGHAHVVVIPDVTIQHNVTVDDRARKTCQGKHVTKVKDPCSFQEPLARVLLNWQFIDVYHYFEEDDQLVTNPDGKRFAMNKTDVFPLQNCSIMGLVSLCPNNPSRLLENWYGERYLDKSQYRCINGKWKDENGNSFEKPFHRKVNCIFLAVLFCLVLILVIGVIWRHKKHWKYCELAIQIKDTEGRLL